MGFKMEETTSDYEVVPFGSYRLKLVSLDEEAKRADWLKADDPTKKVDPYQWKWVFRIVGGDYDGAELWGFTARTVGYSKDGDPYKARQWVDALWGGEYPERGVKDSDVFIGKECIGKVDDKKKDGSPGNRILGIIPLDKGVPVGPAVSEDKGWPLRFQQACMTVMDGRGLNRDQLKAELRKAFPGYTEFSKLHKDAQLPVLEWIEREAGRVPELEEVLEF